MTTGPGEKWSPRFVAGDRIAYASGGPEGGLEFIDGTPGVRGEVSAPSWSTIGGGWCFTATSTTRGRHSSAGTARIRSSASCAPDLPDVRAFGQPAPDQR